MDIIIGHHKNAFVTAVIFKALAEQGHNVIEAEMAQPVYIKIPQPIEPIDCCCFNTKKSKGDKHRERSERRRKWGI